jgi:hypothetical protein
MSDKLNKATVLVLNRNWQAINVRTLIDAIGQIAAGVATALEIERKNAIRTVHWEEWIMPPIREPGDPHRARLKGSCSNPRRLNASNEPQRALLRLAASEAEALAWSTGYGLLFLPALLEECDNGKLKHFSFLKYKTPANAFALMEEEVSWCTFLKG